LNRTYLPLVIAGVFALILLGGLGVFIFRAQPVPPSEAELAASYAEGLKYEQADGVTLDYVQAVAAYRKAAEDGYPQAEYALGLMTEAGRGIVRDKQAAIAWFRRAAEHDLPAAQVRLAGELIEGTATADGKPDKIEALKWLLLGADRVSDPQSKQAAIAISEKLAQGEMTSQDRADAARRASEWRKQHGAAK
jgi:TPR repeat protein